MANKMVVCRFNRTCSKHGEHEHETIFKRYTHTTNTHKHNTQLKLINELSNLVSHDQSESRANIK